jgi:hypothetical protein
MKINIKKQIYELFSVAITIILLFGFVQIIHADDFELSDEFIPTTTSSGYVIDSNDESSQEIKLQFGGTLNKYLLYDKIAQQFQLNADLSLTNYQLKDFRIENAASDPTCSVNHIGRQYFNTTSNTMFYCDGSAWQSFGSGGGGNTTPAAVQARRTSAYAIGTSFGDVSLDTTDLENDSGIIDHDDSNRDRITVKEDGLYRITYSISFDYPSSNTDTEIYTRMRINDASIINGSIGESTAWRYSNTFFLVQAPIHRTFLANMNANDFLSLQLSSQATISTLDNLLVTVTKMEIGASGGGGGGTLDQSYDTGGAGAGRAITVDSGPVILDSSGSSNAPIELTPLSNSPNTNLAGGQLYYDDEGILFSYDSTRTKWLSVQRMAWGFGRNSAGTTNEYLRQFNGASSNTSGWRMMRDGTITAIAAQSDAAQTWSFELRKNDNATPIVSLVINNSAGADLSNLNIDFSAGDFIQGYCNGSSIDYPQAWFEFAWRP